MYLDEAQAWLIARGSANLLELLHHLRYEGHPAMWYLLIYFPSHLSSNMAWMQGINYVLSLGMAWLVLSERRLPLVMRVSIVFSVSIFFYMGVLARSYMLAGVLLIAAARCLLAGRRRHWLAMTLLALAINSHFLAIPVVAGIFVWLYWLAPIASWSAAVGKLKERRFWISAAILGAALAACYFTLRPAQDIYTPQYDGAGPLTPGYLVAGIGRISPYFAPSALGAFVASAQQLLAPWMHLSSVVASLTIGLWLFGVLALSARRSRWFMISVSLLWTAAVWATVHVPMPLHATLLFVGYVIALMMNQPDGRDRPWLRPQLAQLVLVILLGVQTLACVQTIVEECLYPFSGAKATAEWLARTRLTRRPLVVNPDISAPAILAYTSIESAYFPTCRCRGSFVIFRRGRDLSAEVTLQELQALHRQFGAAPIVISYWKLGEDGLQRLGLHLVYVSPNGWFWRNENLFVYDSGDETTMQGAEVKP
jgi:hypothetical protein